jgi:3-phytase
MRKRTEGRARCNSLDRTEGPALLCAASALLAVWLAADVAMAAPRSAPTVDALRIEAASISLLHGKQEVDTFDAGGPIKSLGVSGSLVVWQLDDGTGELRFRSPAGHGPSRSLQAGVEADAICLAPIDDRFYDMYLVEGDGALLHYWLDTGFQPALQPVRTLPVNPDSTGCAVDAGRVYILSPPMGIVAYARDPETDPVMELVYATVPAGAGAVVPVAMRLEPASTGDTLILWDAQGQAWRFDSARPSAARPVEATIARVPLPGAAEHRPPSALATVVPSAETVAVPSSGDAADDPAILVGDTGAAWIVGTNKRLGVHVYDLDGRERHRIERGRTNNIDAIRLSTNEFLLAASNRTERTLDLYRASLAEDRFEFVGALPLDLDDPYGLCMARLNDGRLVVNVGGTDGRNQLWSIDATLAGRLLREFQLDSQTEGCVFDTIAQRLYIGEEAAGIWSFDPDSGERAQFASTTQDLLVPDVEGLDIYRNEDHAWLVVSSQGDDAFVIYPLTNNATPVKLRIAANHAAGIDGVSETDGLAVSRGALPGYPKGILVVQDGRNRAPAQPQNFKIVDWRAIEALLPTP